MYKRLNRERKTKIVQQRIVEKTKTTQLFANAKIIRFCETTRLREAKIVRLAYKKEVVQQKELHIYNKKNCIYCLINKKNNC